VARGVYPPGRLKNSKIERARYELFPCTFDEAMSETDLCVWMVSSWSKHQSSSSIVSMDILRYASSEIEYKEQNGRFIIIV